MLEFLIYLNKIFSDELNTKIFQKLKNNHIKEMKKTFELQFAVAVDGPEEENGNEQTTEIIIFEQKVTDERQTSHLRFT
jgi:hypothetical protein